MEEVPDTFYTEDRWHNWIDRIRDADLDPEDEDGARLLINLQDDTAIAVAKILDAYTEDAIGDDRALAELATVRDTVLGGGQLEDEDKQLLVDGVRTSLVAVFAAAERYVMDGPDDGDLADHIEAAAEAEADGNEDLALEHAAQAGTLVVDGQDLDLALLEDLEYGLVVEWGNGLDSLARAFREPEVVDEG
jgi:hypothetical protein